MEDVEEGIQIGLKIYRLNEVKFEDDQPLSPSICNHRNEMQMLGESSW